jgi:hypothetical protein
MPANSEQWHYCFQGLFDRSMITATDRKTAGLSVGGFDGAVASYGAG